MNTQTYTEGTNMAGQDAWFNDDYSRLTPQNAMQGRQAVIDARNQKQQAPMGGRQTMTARPETQNFDQRAIEASIAQNKAAPTYQEQMIAAKARDAARWAAKPQQGAVANPNARRAAAPPPPPPPAKESSGMGSFFGWGK